MRWFIGVLTAAMLVAAARAGDHVGESDKVLSGTYKTEHFDVRYRPGSRAGASVERAGAMAERDLARICSQLEVKNDARYSLFLFDDVAELSAVTKTTGNAGFSANDASSATGASSYIPYDNDQTRTHEMVHIVAHAKVGDAKTLFFAEGLANALLEYVHGVPVHAVAKYYRKAGKLPPLGEMTGAPDFYAWLGQHPGFDAYDVAASWMRFLIDTHGIAKVKQYYLGKPAKTALGADDAALEKAWIAALDKFDLRPEVEALLKVRDGQGETGITSATFAEKDGWEAIAPQGQSNTWSRKDGALTGTCDSSRWSIWEFVPPKLHRDCVVVAKVRFTGSGGVQLRLGFGNQAMLLPGGTYVYRDEQCVASTAAVKLPSNGTFELAIVRRRGVFEVWVDRTRAIATEAQPDEARVGVGVVYGTATFESVQLRTLE